MFFFPGALEDAIKGVEFRRQSFIIKVWLEAPEKAGEPTRWRGRITHVPSGENQYVNDLEGISTFMAKYLRQMGAGTGLQRDVRGWLHWISRCRERSTKVERNDK